MSKEIPDSRLEQAKSKGATQNEKDANENRNTARHAGRTRALHVQEWLAT
jgi:hypothetical protein